MTIDELINKHSKILGNVCIECGPGWYGLIDKLCIDIQKHIDDGKFEQIYASQVKEKFGSLRFYIEYGDDYIFDLIEEAEDISYTICEHCGSTKNVKQTKGWIKTLCEDCIKKFK
jgi:hypothetical protein